MRLFFKMSLEIKAVQVCCCKMFKAAFSMGMKFIPILNAALNIYNYMEHSYYECFI